MGQLKWNRVFRFIPFIYLKNNDSDNDNTTISSLTHGKRERPKKKSFENEIETNRFLVENSFYACNLTVTQE